MRQPRRKHHDPVRGGLSRPGLHDGPGAIRAVAVHLPHGNRQHIGRLGAGRLLGPGLDLGGKLLEAGRSVGGGDRRRSRAYVDRRRPLRRHHHVVGGEWRAVGIAAPVIAGRGHRRVGVLGYEHLGEHPGLERRAGEAIGIVGAGGIVRAGKFEHDLVLGIERNPERTHCLGRRLMIAGSLVQQALGRIDGAGRYCQKHRQIPLETQGAAIRDLEVGTLAQHHVGLRVGQREMLPARGEGGRGDGSLQHRVVHCHRDGSRVGKVDIDIGNERIGTGIGEHPRVAAYRRHWKRVPEFQAEIALRRDQDR